ncbi:MAG: hypothetical protein KDK70_07855 [Myxococcales bacterium]|nr:hypothetical protein [Myxococcales bacterium]
MVGGCRTLCVDQRWWPLLDALRRQQGFDRVWHGARGGADAGVAAWARARGLEVEEFPAPRSLYREHGRPEHEADARRNDDMLRAWGGYRSRGGSIVPCARAGGFADLVLALPPDDDTRDLVTRAGCWSSIEVMRLWSPCHRWRMHRRGLEATEATMITWGDVAVAADPPLQWGVGKTRAQLRGLLRRQGWTITAREPAPEPDWLEPPLQAKSA